MTLHCFPVIPRPEPAERGHWAEETSLSLEQRWSSSLQPPSHHEVNLGYCPQEHWGGTFVPSSCSVLQGWVREATCYAQGPEALDQIPAWAWAWVTFPGTYLGEAPSPMPATSRQSADVLIFPIPRGLASVGGAPGFLLSLFLNLVGSGRVIASLTF